MDNKYLELANYVLNNLEALKKLNLEELEEIEEALIRGNNIYDNKGD